MSDKPVDIVKRLPAPAEGREVTLTWNTTVRYTVTVPEHELAERLKADEKFGIYPLPDGTLDLADLEGETAGELDGFLADEEDAIGRAGGRAESLETIDREVEAVAYAGPRDGRPSTALDVAKPCTDALAPTAGDLKPFLLLFLVPGLAFGASICGVYEGVQVHSHVLTWVGICLAVTGCWALTFGKWR